MLRACSAQVNPARVFGGGTVTLDSKLRPQKLICLGLGGVPNESSQAYYQKNKTVNQEMQHRNCLSCNLQDFLRYDLSHHTIKGLLIR